MANKMLIDASHPEETRVVVTRGNKVEEFDFESANRRQLRGNIYLAKVTRVEPSLQAAFIEYGGNRHGFLAFGEIHPDYYQIPVADREALLAADERAEREAEEGEERRSRGGREGGGREGGGREGGGRRRRGAQRRNRRDGETISAEASPESDRVEAEQGIEAVAEELTGAEGMYEGGAAADRPSYPDSTEYGTSEPGEAVSEAVAISGEVPAAEAPEAETLAVSPEPDDSNPVAGEPLAEDGRLGSDPEETGIREELSAADEEADRVGEEGHDEDEEGEDEDEEEDEEHAHIEHVGGADALEEVPERPRVHRRHYKIQEVIKRRQILLVQVVKEERGNKGAALTTYLSLAGRYAVLMPNTGKGGGISRKITSAEDRKRLKEIVQDLEVPDGMGIILRTAGAARTKPEIKRDFEYLMRLWESVRELTLKSSAPALVYEEGSLIKRAIRDLYNKDIDDVVVSGEEGHREAKDFMRMIMPSQTNAVRLYQEPQALFAQFGIEAQLDAMFSNHVTLKAGGYIVINPTEALVSIDVNSGRATREHNIEDTALKTNLEAAEEIARQLRLRDLAGLIVIDFIDMEERRNDRAVEKKLKDCLKDDRARIQVGRISPFGLLEMSRQRIRTGVLESSSVPCRHCAATGFVRSVPSVALQVLRSVEESLLRSTTHNLIARTRSEVAFYILNQKRAHLSELESRFGVAVSVAADETLTGAVTFAVDRGTPVLPSQRPVPSTGIRVDSIAPPDEQAEMDEENAEAFERDEARPEPVSDDGARVAEARESRTEEDGGPRRRRRRRRGRGGQRETEDSPTALGEAGDEDEQAEAPLSNGALQTALEVEGDTETQQTVEPFGEAEVIERPRTYTEGASSMGSPAYAGDYADRRPARPDAATDIEASPDPERDTLAEVAERRPEPEPEPVAIVLTQPDPDRPKRGGWWSKAKAALSGS